MFFLGRGGWPNPASFFCLDRMAGFFNGNPLSNGAPRQSAEQGPDDKENAKPWITNQFFFEAGEGDSWESSSARARGLMIRPFWHK